MAYGFKLGILLIPLFYFVFYFSQIKKPSFSILANTYLILVIGVTLASFGKYVYVNYQQPLKWDFLSFWLNGKVGISGENFYNAENYREIALPYDPGDVYREEIIDTAFWYPPFTMLLFLPLGLFTISQAYLLWQISNLLLCAACIYGLWKLFLHDYGLLSLALISALLLRLESTRLTFIFAQTNFLTLLFFLLFWKNRLKNAGGIWLALCVMVKPYMVFLYLYPLLARKWRMLTISVLALLALTFLSLIVFGSDVFVSFLNNPIPETPSWNYTEVTNQSLLATILRLTQPQVEAPLLNSWYLGISLLLTLTTVFVAIKKNNNHDWVVLSILFLALIVYPANQMFYSIFLIVPMALLLRNLGDAVQKRIIIFFILFITYFLSGYDSGSYTFYANVFMWLVCITLSMKSNFEREDISNPVVLPDVLPTL